MGLSLLQLRCSKEVGGGQYRSEMAISMSLVDRWFSGVNLNGQQASIRIMACSDLYLLGSSIAFLVVMNVGALIGTLVSGVIADR